MLICVSFAYSRKMGHMNRSLPIWVHTGPSSFYLSPGSPGSLSSTLSNSFHPTLPLTPSLSFIPSWYSLGSILLSFFYAFTYFSQLLFQALRPLQPCLCSPVLFREKEVGEEKRFCCLSVATISITSLVYSEVPGNAWRLPVREGR